MNASLDTARMLASILGEDVEEATTLLERCVLVNALPSMAKWAEEIGEVISRTVSLAREPGGRIDLELVVGRATPLTSAVALFVEIGADRAVVGSARPTVPPGKPSRVFEAAAAALVAAAAVRAVIDDTRLPSSPDPLEVRAKDFGIPDLKPGKMVQLENTVLVGAGAVAHGFLWALRDVPVSGRLDVVDPKSVGPGNLNRCLYLRPGDEGGGKADLLVRRASPDLPGVELNAVTAEFKDFAHDRAPVGTMIVTVDSRLARRKLQKFLPGRVVDASTTDVREVVVHSNRQPTQGACLACLYRHTPDEFAWETSIAEGLGLDVDTVRQGFVTKEAAARIARVYPGDPSLLVGKAFDTLFRELCGTQALRTPEGRQVLTPFAFVSALAGALLAIELIRQHSDLPETGGWHVDPWRGPVGRSRRPTARSSTCEVCAVPHFTKAARSLWGDESDRQSA